MTLFTVGNGYGKWYGVEFPWTGDEEDLWDDFGRAYPYSSRWLDPGDLLPYTGEAVVSDNYLEGDLRIRYCIAVDGVMDTDEFAPKGYWFESRSAAREFIDSCPEYDGMGDRVTVEPRRWDL